jgi:hypothetical protein
MTTDTALRTSPGVGHPEPLKAEVLIDNKDVGFVRVGQAVHVKLAAFEFQKYGMLAGTVTLISPRCLLASAPVRRGNLARQPKLPP